MTVRSLFSIMIQDSTLQRAQKITYFGSVSSFFHFVSADELLVIDLIDEYLAIFSLELVTIRITKRMVVRPPPALVERMERIIHLII